jgi:excisionase family DNA binding protein
VEVTTIQDFAAMESRNEIKTQTIDEAAKELGIGRNQAYAAAKRGEIPTIGIGKRILVLREPFKKMLAGGSA